METNERIDDGGPAYPTPVVAGDMNWNQGSIVIAPDKANGGGMSLRDHFAGLAMQAEMITSFSDATPEAAADFQEAMHAKGRTALQHLACNAYEVADAMLLARKAGAK